jgi:hypothetical protein
MMRRLCAGMLVSLGDGWLPLGKDGAFYPTSAYSHAGTLQFDDGETYPVVQLHPGTAARVYAYSPSRVLDHHDGQIATPE